jgi:hypothetical protein
MSNSNNFMGFALAVNKSYTRNLVPVYKILAQSYDFNCKPVELKITGLYEFTPVEGNGITGDFHTTKGGKIIMDNMQRCK